MIKTISLIKRLPPLSREAFRDHYETGHAPLALPYLAGLMRYVRYHVEEFVTRGASGASPFDVISAFWYRDQEAVEEVFKLLESEAGKAILEDEKKFMDKAANRFFAVSERKWLEQEGEQPFDEEGNEHFFVFAARPKELSRYDCSRQLTDWHWPSLIEALGDVEFAFLRDAFPMEGEAGLWDGIMQLRSDNRSALLDWVDEMSRSGYRIVAARTRRFETLLPESGIPFRS